jgi:DNA-binding NtrC family response regulator
MANILIVDDEAKIGKLLSAELGDEGHRTSHTTDPKEALRIVREQQPDILITDLRMDGMDGISLLKKTREVSPGTDVIVMTAYASIETAIETMREGAYDYIIKPFKTEELLLLVSRLEEKRRLQTENQDLRSYLSGEMGEEIVGSSPAMMAVKRIIQGLAKSNAAVLIRGDSGTGKELVARAIHRVSLRASGPFIALNCAAIPETLLESELFGYERGAFTGATRRKIGHFQLAHRGTLFLDEIGDLPMILQAKLLRVLENGVIQPLGSEKEVTVDIRLISATHRALEKEIRENAFREDLYYRLNVFPIALPPLRERKEDIPAIAAHFLSAWRRKPSDLSVAARQKLLGYHWPGNIRELRNVLERSTILRPEGSIGADDIRLGDLAGEAPTPESHTLNLEEIEKRAIQKALAEAGGNKSEAARLLGITRRALYGRLGRFGLE